MNDLVSIIVPVYNKGKYLRKCLDSIINQTYENFEVLLIDDASSDDGGAICDEYVESDSRFKVFHLSENGGSGHARNVGLDNASGVWTIFMDADDAVLPCYIDRLLSVAIDNHTSVVACEYLWAYNPNISPDYVCSETVPTFIDVWSDDYRLDKKYAQHCVCGGIYATDLIGDIRFYEDLSVGEDITFMSRLCKKAKTYFHINEQLYIYYIHKSSAFFGALDDAKMTEIIAWERLFEIFDDFSQGFKDSLKGCYLAKCYQLLEKAVYCNKQEYIDSLQKKMRLNIDGMQFINASCKRKFAMRMSCSNRLFYYIWKRHTIVKYKRMEVTAIE